jgi:hypothetical protein
MANRLIEAKRHPETEEDLDSQVRRTAIEKIRDGKPVADPDVRAKILGLDRENLDDDIRTLGDIVKEMDKDGTSS